MAGGGEQQCTNHMHRLRTSFNKLSSLPSLCSGVGLGGERVPLLLSIASSTLRSEYSPSPSISNETSGGTAEGGGLEGL